ncbi:hypothetical protein BLNAU_24556 [Blattamonas nauphoetae]|uniref:Uncharacterized protein n=1 Tax=Blattamonas nauphoetae TaxID=2049346 RepID=A0ABQ9WPY6_9EUKA|nr:hypothetical protein BLNAU_24556 [Blattamonas nauphoetae]
MVVQSFGGGRGDNVAGRPDCEEGGRAEGIENTRDAQKGVDLSFPDVDGEDEEEAQEEERRDGGKKKKRDWLANKPKKMSGNARKKAAARTAERAPAPTGRRRTTNPRRRRRGSDGCGRAPTSLLHQTTTFNSTRRASTH